MRISEETELDIFSEKAKEIMENTEAIIEKIMVQGEQYKKSQIGDDFSFNMENGLEVNKSPEMTWIGNSSTSYVNHRNKYPEYDYIERIYSGIYLKVMNQMGFHTVELIGCQNDCIYFSAEITRDYEGNYTLGNGVGTKYLDTADWSLFDMAIRSITETDDEDSKKKLGILASKEEKIKVLDKFKDMLGVDDLKKSGDTRPWLIDAIIKLAEKYKLSPKEWEEMNKRYKEIKRQELVGKDQEGER